MVTLREVKNIRQTVFANNIYLEGKAVFHAVDEATNFKSASWLFDLTFHAPWRVLRIMLDQRLP